MADTFKKLASGLLDDAVGILYTCPALTTAIVKPIKLANIDAAPRTVTLYQDGVDDAHTLVPALIIPALGTAEDSEGVVVEAGGTIQGFADVVDTVAYAIYGLEVS